MPPILYTVTATLVDESQRDRYIAWLVGGHVQEVIASGAQTALVARLDAEPDTSQLPQVEVRYLFESRAALDVYLRDHAPRLRAQGLALFGPGSGATFRRRTGDVVFDG